MISLPARLATFECKLSVIIPFIAEVHSSEIPDWKRKIKMLILYFEEKITNKAEKGRLCLGNLNFFLTT